MALPTAAGLARKATAGPGRALTLGVCRILLPYSPQAWALGWGTPGVREAPLDQPPESASGKRRGSTPLPTGFSTRGFKASGTGITWQECYKAFWNPETSRIRIPGEACVTARQANPPPGHS